jgi:DNA-binding transcriptional LysR family regulator
MNTPLDLDTFVALVEAGSLSEAARATGEPRATLSRRLAKLEEHFGVRLIHRSTRRFEPTRAGRDLYARGRRIVDEVRAAEQALRSEDGAPRGPLRISLPPSGGVFSDLLATFMQAYPEVQPDVFVTDRHVDLIGEGVDVAIRGGSVEDPSLIQRVLFRHASVLVGSRTYLDRRGRPATLEALSGHVVISGYAGGVRPHRALPLRGGGTIRVEGGIATNDLAVTLGLAVAGRGLAVLPDVVVEPYVAQGTLEIALANVVGAALTTSIVYAERALIEPQVRAFIDHTLAFLDAHFLTGACRDTEHQAPREPAASSSPPQ